MLFPNMWSEYFSDLGLIRNEPNVWQSRKWCLYRILLDIFLCFDQKPTQHKIWKIFTSASFIERSLFYKLCYLLWFSILKQRHEICCIINRRFLKTDFLTECYSTYQSILRKISINFYSFDFKPIVIHGFIENWMLYK